MADMNSVVRNPIVLGGAAVLVVAAAVGGYFLGANKTGGSMLGGTKTAAVGGVCGATLSRASNIGLIDSTATLASADATATDTKGREVCTAKAGATTYTLTVDVLCDDMSQGKCLNLYKVTDSAGATLYQRTKFLDPT